jgi:hypothetical protein
MGSLVAGAPRPLADPEELVAAQERSSAFMFDCIDLISGVLVADYGTERERVMRSEEQLRAETVRTILADGPVDEEVAGSRLGYELRRHHVALRVRGRGRELRGLERSAREVAAVLGAGEPLVVGSGAASVDVWRGTYAPPQSAGVAALDDYVPPEGDLVAVGRPGHGIDGFRRSHAEALVAALAGGAAATVIRYERVELVSLLASDFPRARTFVAARLGPLAAATEPAARLRETVLAFLAANRSATKVAKELYVHPRPRQRPARPTRGWLLGHVTASSSARFTLPGRHRTEPAVQRHPGCLHALRRGPRHTAWTAT